MRAQPRFLVRRCRIESGQHLLDGPARNDKLSGAGQIFQPAEKQQPRHYQPPVVDMCRARAGACPGPSIAKAWRSGFSPIPRAFLEAMKTYGMILADNGSAFYFQSEDDPRWTDDLDELKDVPASAFEALEPGTFYP